MKVAIFIALFFASIIAFAHDPTVPDSIYVIADGWQRKHGSATVHWASSSGPRIGATVVVTQGNAASDSLALRSQLGGIAYATGTHANVIDTVSRWTACSDTLDEFVASVPPWSGKAFRIDSVNFNVWYKNGVDIGECLLKLYAVLHSGGGTFQPQSSLSSGNFNDYRTQGVRDSVAFDSVGFATGSATAAMLTFRSGTHTTIFDSVAHLLPGGNGHAWWVQIVTCHDYYNDSTSTNLTQTVQSVDIYNTEYPDVTRDPHFLVYWTELSTSSATDNGWSEWGDSWQTWGKGW